MAIYDDGYAGPRWTYGLRNRPMMMDVQPKGFILGSERPHADWRFGTVQYPEKLSDEDLYSFELTLVSGQQED